MLTDDRELLCKRLCLFTSNLREEDGSPYTPQSIAQLFAKLQCYINVNKSEPVGMVDPSNTVFNPLHKLLDRLYCDLHAEGIGTKKK